MFISRTVFDWRIDGGRRVPNKTSGNTYILNTNRIFEMTESHDGYPTFYYFDNPADSRCGGARMKTNGDIASYIAASNSSSGSNAVTLDYFPNADVTEATEEITLAKVNIAYTYPYRHDIFGSYCWVVYVDAGWDIKSILVDHGRGELLTLLEETV